MTGEKDDVNPDGSIKAQMFDNESLVSLLTAALQEAHTKINDLTTRTRRPRSSVTWPFQSTSISSR